MNSFLGILVWVSITKFPIWFPMYTALPKVFGRSTLTPLSFRCSLLMLAVLYVFLAPRPEFSTLSNDVSHY